MASNNTNMFPPDDEIVILDDSDEDISESSNSKDPITEKPSISEKSACKNPRHHLWGNNDTNYKWPSQVSISAQQVFRLLGYERQPGTRCKFCVTCVHHANNLSDEEISEIGKNYKGAKNISQSRRESEMRQIQAQIDKLEHLDISDEEKAQQAKQLRQLAFVNPGKFMEDFDPETSTREMKKMNRRIYKEKNSRKNQLYTDQGRLITTEKDLCDCLDTECPGCHFPCPKCNSEKCGADCRRNRRWYYEYVELEGTGVTLNWPNDVLNNG